MISNTDKKIILELQKNGRATYADLSSKLGISVSTAATRTERLIDSKIIEIRAIPNPFKMGVSANALIAIQAEPLKIDTICDQLIDNSNISTLFTVFGRYDILIFVFSPTWEIMHDFINEKLSKISGVLRLETYYIKNNKKRYEGHFDESEIVSEPVKLNEIEWKLITELTKHGRMNMKEISEKIGMHVSTISRRIHSLVDKGLIKIVAVPNPQSFGYSSNAFILLDVEAMKVDRICKTLFPYPEIVHITTLINSSGIIIGIQTRNNETLYKFIKEKVAQTNGIQRIETFITAELKKRYYGWFIEEKDI